MTTATLAPLTASDARTLHDDSLAGLIDLAEEVLGGRRETDQPVDRVIEIHRLLTDEAAFRRRASQLAPKEAIVTVDRATSHIGCTHPRTKVARAACRRARARAAQPTISLVKDDTQLWAAVQRIARKGCQGTVKSGARAGQRCGRPVVNETVVCSGHARSFKIAR
jgi:hypothetical protein